MPRPRKTKASPVFKADPHKLSEEARAAMLCALGRDEKDGPDFVLDFVEQMLGAYPSLVENIGRRPVASLYVTEFSRLARKATALSSDLANLGGYFRHAVLRKRFDTDALAHQLAAFHEVATAIARDHKGKGENRARGDATLRTTIQILRKIFSKHYAGPVEAQERDPFGPRPEQKRREEEFVRAALLDARIILKSESPGRLRRFLREPLPDYPAFSIPLPPE